MNLTTLHDLEALRVLEPLGQRLLKLRVGLSHAQRWRRPFGSFTLPPSVINVDALRFQASITHLRGGASSKAAPEADVLVNVN